MPEAFETIAVPGYVVSLDYHDSPPPAEICSTGHRYHPGYVELTVRVTADNLSVCERIDTVFFLAPTEFESHDIITSERGMSIPLVLGERITEFVFGSRSFELNETIEDYDLIIIMVNNGGSENHSVAYLSFKHDKEAGFSELLLHG
jgi:hypothetical protein